jgi:hypothetical protein
MSRRCTTCYRHEKQFGLDRGDCPGQAHCRRCPWPPCDCGHKGSCEFGWVEVPVTNPFSMANVELCPTCAQARYRWSKPEFRAGYVA